MPSYQDEQFEELYRHHAGLILKTVRAFALDPSDRDDLHQEILIALCQAMPRFDARAKLSTYVYRVALSSALNWKRSHRRYRQKINSLAQQAPSIAAATSDDHDRLDWIYARIRELPPVDRTVIVLSLDQLSYNENRRNHGHVRNQCRRSPAPH